MHQANPDFMAKLEAIKAEYTKESLPTQVAELTTRCDDLRDASPEGGLNATAQAVHAAAHKLTGSSGTFGYAEISVKSREICNLTERARIDVTPFNTHDRNKVIILVDQLQLLLNAVTAGHDKDEHETPKTDTANGLGLPDKGAVVVLCDANSYTVIFAEKFIAQEFKVIRIDQVDELFQTVLDSKAEVVVADLDMDNDSVVDEQEFLKLNSVLDHDVSLIFVSAQADMTARLAAVRAGGDAFVIAPFEESELMDTIDRLTDTGLKAPHRVIIIDKDEEFTQLVSDTLEKSGMICEVVTNPNKTLDALASFVPEAILMDISMPGCTGQELASVILQQETFVGTPIIFISEDRRREGRVDVVRQGSYSFMAKPIDLEKLIGVIRGQAIRFRALRARMVKDSLTGLNNSSMTRRLLEREIDNARRTKLPLSFAMIDIDLFKDINDTFGHANGDKVLRSLSRLLKQRFRSNDVIGRLGGEEFGVVIAGTTGVTSKIICDQVREAFAELQFDAQGEIFSCKFSAGIAEFPDFQSSSEIMEAADRALYEAKNAGRNLVVLANHKNAANRTYSGR